MIAAALLPVLAHPGFDRITADVFCTDDEAGRAAFTALLQQPGAEPSRQTHVAHTTPVVTFSIAGGAAAATFYGPEFDHTEAAPGSWEWDVLSKIADAERAGRREH